MKGMFWKKPQQFFACSD